MNNLRLDVLSDLVFRQNKVVTSLLIFNTYLFVGNSQGYTRLYNFEKQTEIKSYYINELEAFNNRSVLSMDVSDDGNFLICGYANGYMIVWETYSTKTKKTIEDTHKSAVVKIKFVSSTPSSIKFLSSETDGKLFINEITDGYFYSSCDSKLLVKEQTTIFQLDTLKIPLFAQNKFSNELITSEVFGFCSLNSVKVYRIHPKQKKLLDVPKPDHLENKVLPDMTFGVMESKTEGGIKSVLAIAWGSIISLYTFQEELFEFLPSNIQEVNHVVLRIGFLSPGILFCFDYEKDFCILNVDAFTGKVRKDKRGSILWNTKLSSQNKISTNKEMQFQSNLQENSQQVKKASYVNTVVSFGNHFVYYGKRDIYLNTMLNWEKSLKFTFENSEWFHAFLLGIDLYKGKTTGLADVEISKEFREVKVKRVLEDLIEQYATINSASINSNNINNPDKKQQTLLSINVCIEFSIEIDSTDHLMNVIQPIYDLKGFGDIFIESMEPYILSDRMKEGFLSQATLSKIVSLYDRKKKYLHLNQLLCHFEVNQIDFDYMRKMCLKHSLVDSLFHIFSNGKDVNFFYPVEIAFEAFKSAQDRNIKSYYEQTKDNPVELINAFDSKDYYGYKILFYIDNLTKGQTYMGKNEIGLGEQLNICIKLLHWLVKDVVFAEFIAFDSLMFLTQLENILRLEIISAMLMEDGKLEVLTESGDKYMFTILVLTEKLIAFKNNIKDYETNCYINNFMVKVASIYPDTIDKKYLFDAVLYLIRCNPFQVTDKKEDAEWDADYIDEVTKNILDLILKSSNFTIEDKEMLILETENTPFNYLQVELCNETRSFIKALKCFFLPEAEKSFKNRKKVLFTWINSTLNDLMEDADEMLDDLKEEILVNLPNLAQVDPLSTSLLVDVWFRNRQNEAINYFKEQPELQLKYIEQIIEKDVDKIEKAVNNELTGDDAEELFNYYFRILKKHIKLLCILNKKRVIEVLQNSSFYPLDECLKKCEKYGAKEAAIYINQKLGDVHEAIGLSMNVNY